MDSPRDTAQEPVSGTEPVPDSGPASGSGQVSDSGLPEYRAAELAERAGITRRTLRFYRERKLLPPPRREGRIAWYNEHHLARLRTIGALLARGHALGGIAELITAFEQGRDGRGAAELLGLEEVMGGSWSQETPVRLAPEELADHFADGVTADDLAAALDLGYVRVDGDHLVHASQRLLEVSSALVREGVPLSAVLAAGRTVRAHADAIAVLFTDLVRDHVLRDVLDRLAGPPAPGRAPDGTVSAADTPDTDGTTGRPDAADPGAGSLGGAGSGGAGSGGAGSGGAGSGGAGSGGATGAPRVEADLRHVAEALDRLRPLSQQVIDAEVSMAMDRRVRSALRTWLSGHHPSPDPEPHPRPEPKPEDTTPR